MKSPEIMLNDSSYSLSVLIYDT